MRGRSADSVGDFLLRKIKAFYLNQSKPTIAQTYRHIVVPYYAQDGRQAPHLSTVRRFLNESILPMEKAAFREGKGVWKADYAPKVRRDPTTLAVNEWWCADHRKLDKMVVYPDGKGKGWGRHGRLECPCGSRRERRSCCSLRRPWVTMIIDIRTAGIVGYTLCRTPSAATVTAAFRAAALDRGLPSVFYVDNGKEFHARETGGAAGRSRDLEELGDDWLKEYEDRLHEITGAAAWRALGVNIVTSQPYSAWSKPIEPLFGAFFGRFENLGAGWTGHNAEERPDALDGQIEKGDVLLWQEFGPLFELQVKDWNGNHCCGDRERPPAAHYAGDYERRAVSERDLGFLLQRKVTRKVTQWGIELKTGRYGWNTETRHNEPALSPYVGCKVVVRYNPDAPGRAFVYPEEGTVIAVERSEPAYYGEFNESNRAVKRAERAQRARLNRTSREIRGALSETEADPTGEFAVIQARKRRLEAEADRRALEPAPLNVTEKTNDQVRRHNDDAVDQWVEQHGGVSEAAQAQEEAAQRGEEGEDEEEYEHYADRFMRRMRRGLGGSEEARNAG